MKHKPLFFYTAMLVIATSSCSSGTAVVPSAVVSATSTAVPQQTDSRATLAAVPTIIEPATAAPAINWPTRKITVDNIDSLRLLQSWGKGRADQVFRSPDGDIVVVSGAGMVSVYQGAALAPLYRLPDVQATAVSFASSVLVASYPGLPGKETPIKIYDLKSGEMRAEVSHKLDHYLMYAYDDVQRARDEGQPDVTAIALSPDGTVLALGFGDGRLDVWDIAGTPRTVARQAYPDAGPHVLRFSPSGKSLLVDNQLYQFPGMKLVKTWQDTVVGPVMPDGQTIFLSKGTDVFQVEMETSKELARIPLDMNVTRLELTEDGTKLVVYTDRAEGSQQIYYFYRQILAVPGWAVIEQEKRVDALDQYTDPGAEPPLTEAGHIPALRGVEIVDNKLVAWGLYGSLPFWWFPLDGKVTTVRVPDGNPLGFHYQDQAIVSCAPGSITLWLPDQPAKTIQVDGLNNCDHIQINNKGDVVAIAAGPDIGLLNLVSAKTRYLQESYQDLSRLTFSGDDSIFAAGTVANRDVAANIFFWNGTVGYPISHVLFPEDKKKSPDKNGHVVLERDAADVLNILVSADNAIGITFTENVRIWDISTGKQTGFIPYVDSAFTSTGAISPDKTLLVLGDENGKLHFWDLQKMTGISVLAKKFFSAHTGSVNMIVFNHDGTAILTAGEDGTVHLWGIP